MWLYLIQLVKGLKSKNWGLPEKKKFCLKTAGSNQLYANKFFFLSCKINSCLSFQFAQQTVDFLACTIAQLHSVHLLSSVWLFATPWTAVDPMDHYSFSKSLSIYVHTYFTHTHTFWATS